MSRRAKIEAMLQDDPNDTFLRYSLALELDKEGETSPCLEELRRLMEEDPPYVPAFHMAGQILVKSGRAEDARTALRRGIEAARAQSRQHDAAEMADLLATIGG